MKKGLSLFLILLTCHLQAQNILRLQHINVEDGLSQSSVNYIFQDAHGFMWFATGDGLDRYDGKEFISYKGSFNDSASSHLKGRNINSNVFEDKQNRLWLCTDEGISYMDYRRGRSQIVKDGNGQLVYAMPLTIDSGQLWCIESQTGIYAINISDLKYRFYPFTEKLQTNRQIANTIFNGVKTPSGIWMVDKAGLLFFDVKTHKDERVTMNDHFNSINLLQSGVLLIIMNDGVYLFNPDKRTFSFIAIKNKDDNRLSLWRSFTEDTATHTVYIGAANNGSICKLNLDTHKYEFIDFQNKDINCLYVDRSRNLWIGTEGNGLYKLDIKQPKFSCFVPDARNRSKDVNGLMVKSIYRDDSGKIWMGTFDNGLIVYDPASGSQKKIPFPFSTEDHLIGSIMKDSAGSLVVTIDSKIFWLEQGSGRVVQQTELPFIRSISSHNPIIYALIEWRKGHYLAGTDNGLFQVNNENGKASSCLPDSYRLSKCLGSWIYCLYKGNNNTIYIGRRNGIVTMKIFDDTACSVIDTRFPSISIRHFYKCSTGPILWIATEKGLVAYNETTKQYKVFDETNGVPNSFVYAILAQNDSSLWISTNKGIANLQVHYGQDTNIIVQCTSYTSRDGLQSNEFNTGAYYKCDDGTFMFGGIAGINWFKPGDILQNPYKAQPAISSIFINDSLFAGDTAIYINSLTLPYNRNTISLSFRALEYTQPEQNQYAYKLEGQDKEWVYTSNDKVRYSNLQPGSYKFLLKASNNEGAWNDEPLAIHIIILPPYWKTWWFNMLIVVSGILLIIVGVRLYVKQKVKTKTRELEQQQALYKERLRISKDVHDDLGSGLSKISLMAEIAHTRIGSNIPLGNEMKHISTVSKELVDNMRDLIWVLNPENTKLEQLVSRLREYCADYLENIPIKVTLDFPDKIPEMRISREAQRNIFLTVKEAINNCIKHSGASEINIGVRLTADALTICISDNGKGFDPNHLKGSGNGLRNMRHRIELIGGTFNITSLPNGTRIDMVVSFERLADEKIPL